MPIGELISGPDLLEERYDHAAGIIIDEVTNEEFVATVGAFIESTEILQDYTWILGKNTLKTNLVP